MLEFQDFAGQCLAEGQDGAAAKLGEVDFFAHLFAHFIVGVNLLCGREGNLAVFVLQFVVGHYFAVAVDFKVALVGVDNDVEVFVGAKDFGNHAAKAFFEHADHSGAVNVFGLLKFGEGVNKTNGFCLFLCHIV